MRDLVIVGLVAGAAGGSIWGIGGTLVTVVVVWWRTDDTWTYYESHPFVFAPYVSPLVF